MNRVVRWIAAGVAVVAAAALLAVGGIYVVSERVIVATYPLPPSSFHASTGAEAVARGKRLASAFGCADCHMSNLQGGYLDFAGYKSRNLTRLAKSFSDADFDRAVRAGIRPDGTSVAGEMPSDAYRYMPDADFADIVAYIRSLPASGEDIPTPSYDLAARWRFVTGKDHTDQFYFALKPALDLGPAHAKGRILAMTACGECHVTTLTGATQVFAEGVTPPDLSLVASYSRVDFLHFMHTGKAAGNRELTLMSDMARLRFSHFTDAELGDIYDYLAARGHKLNGG
jgi:mono/diheme cytochrome c family protein